MIRKLFKLPLTTNPILMSDSYKYSHLYQLQPGTTRQSSYTEARGFPEGQGDYIVAAGNQRWMLEYLQNPFNADHIDDAEIFLEMHGEPFCREAYEYILGKYMGYWPVEVQTVPEGIVIKTSNVITQIMNTDPKCAWVTAWLETTHLRGIWPTSTVATISANIRELIEDYIKETSDVPEQLPFKLHDFGARGTSSQGGAWNGLGHLIPFSGTDTVEAIAAIIDFYDCSTMPGFSIPAAEHSTITQWGKEGEADAYKNMIKQFAGEGKIYAVVSDSYDIYNAVGNIWGKQLKDKVLEAGGTVVIRPDSGNPPDVVLKCLELLGETFGYEFNSKGYKVLNPAVRVIQGDGINYHSIKEILRVMTTNKWAIDNVAFGMGGALLQHMDRDTYKWAMKCSSTKVDGVDIDVFKDPITDKGKISKKGRLALIIEDGEYKTIREDELGDRKNELLTVYRNGTILVWFTFDDLRENFEATFRK
jgi:nicotinamide phosphoribosyltransferase